MIKAVKSICILLLLTSSAAFSQKAAEEALAIQYYQNGAFDKAADIYEKLYDRGNTQQYYDLYLNALLKLRRYGDAEKVIRRMMKSFPENANYFVDYGRLLEEKGQRDKAREWYSNLVKDLPKNEFAIRELSISFYRAEAYEFSVKALLNGRKLLHDDTAFAFDLISLYRYQKNKVMLVEEYMNLLSKSKEASLVSQAENMLSNIFESAEDYDMLKTALLKRLQKEPQNIAFTELLAWQYIQKKEFGMALKQIIAIDKRLREDGGRVYDLATMLIDNQVYDTAIEGLQYIINKGKESPFYIPAKIQILHAKNQLLVTGAFNQNELQQLENDYLEILQQFGRSKNTIAAIRQLANLQAYYLNKVPAAISLLEETLKIKDLPLSAIGQTKLDLGNMYLLNNEIWEAALVFGQVEKDFANEPNGQEAKFRGAKLSYYQGDFEWAKAQLDVLKSSTSQLIANDALNLSLLIQENTATPQDTNALKKFAYADLLIFKNNAKEALLVLDSIPRTYPGNSLEDDILMSKAKIYLKQGNIQEAINQLETISKNFSADLWADDALFMLGEIYETRLKNLEKAKTYFQKIITDYPGSLYVTEARKRFRNLRGDNIG